MLVATANVLRTITPREAAAALGDVLDHQPDLVGLQEWGRGRRGLLAHDPAYDWVSSWFGENALGWRRDRYRLRSHRLCPVAGLGWADRGSREVPVLPPRVVLRVRLTDLDTGRDVSAVVYHLVPGVQSRGAYRDDRARLVGRHRAELRRLGHLVGRELAAGAQVHAMGDANFDALEIPGLVSAWAGRRDDPRGTFGTGGRKIDDVFSAGPAEEVVLLENASDHAAVLVRR